MSSVLCLKHEKYYSKYHKTIYFLKDFDFVKKNIKKDLEKEQKYENTSVLF